MRHSEEFRYVILRSEATPALSLEGKNLSLYFRFFAFGSE